MKSNEKDLLELVFENRNRAYGAYLLRRSYPATMRNALLFTIAGLLAAFAGPWLLAAANRPVERLTIDRDISFDEPPEFEKPPAPPPVEALPPVAPPQKKFVLPLVVDNNTPVDIPPPDLGPNLTANVGKKDIAGDPNSTAPPIDEPTDLGEKGKVEAVKPVVPEKELIWVESMPQFPGGDAALLKYLAESIRYPALAVETGTEGRVFVTFVVEKDGRITDLKVVKDIGAGCGKEALRVVASMPAWRPGNQNGNAVRVRMNLPVLFQLRG